MGASHHASPDSAVPLPSAGMAGPLAFTFYWASQPTWPAGWLLARERRPHAALWLVLDGEVHAEVSGEKRICGPGWLITTPPGVPRSAENRAAVPLRLCSLGFDIRVWGEVDFFRVYRVPDFHHTGDPERLTVPWGELLAELRAHAGRITLTAEGWARVLVGRWLELLEADHCLQPASGVDARLPLVLADIEADLAGNWDVSRLSELMHLGAGRVRQLFVRGLGQPPMQYLRGRRLAHARSLLADTELPAAEIAQRCGFADPAHFSRLFRGVVGMQPTAYRERSQLRGESE